MSRSALLRAHQMKAKAATSGPIDPPPPAPDSTVITHHYAVVTQQYPQMMMPGLVAPQVIGYLPSQVPPVIPPQPFVPIPLTGDEEDDDPEAVKANTLPMHGSSSNFNINNLLFNNVMENEYFRALYQLRTYHEVIDEIYRSVHHVEPWQAGTARLPSTAFCLLVKFMLMKLTLKQMKGLLGAQDNPLVRAIGLLYLRYTCPPADLWKWYEPLLEDEEEIHPSADQTVSMSIGAYCIKLLTDMQYFGTTLPRIPVPIERKMKVLLLLLEEKKRRRRTNIRLIEDEEDRLARGKASGAEKRAFSAGCKVRAIYSDEESEPAWYDAVIDQKDDEKENKYWVTFTEYGNQECVDLGDMEIVAAETAQRSRSSESASPNRLDEGGKRRRREEGEERRDQDRDERDRRSDRRSYSNSRERDRDRGGRRHGVDDRDRKRDRDGRKGDRSRHRDRSEDSDSGADRERERDRHKHRSDRSSSRSSSRAGGGDRGAGAGGAVGSSSSSSSSLAANSLWQKVLNSEREASAAVGRNYGQRPASYKGSLSLKIDRYTVRKKSPSPVTQRGGGGGGGARGRSRSPTRKRSRDRDRRDRNRDGDKNRDRDARGGGGEGGGSTRPSAGAMSHEQAQRMKMLKARYGDASSSNN